MQKHYQGIVRALLPALLVALLSMTSACGKKGSLYLPDKTKPDQSQKTTEKRKTNSNEDSQSGTGEAEAR